MNSSCGADRRETKEEEERDDGSFTVHTVDQIYMWVKSELGSHQSSAHLWGEEERFVFRQLEPDMGEVVASVRIRIVAPSTIRYVLPSQAYYGFYCTLLIILIQLI